MDWIVLLDRSELQLTPNPRRIKLTSGIKFEFPESVFNSFNKRELLLHSYNIYHPSLSLLCKMSNSFLDSASIPANRTLEVVEQFVDCLKSAWEHE